MRWLQQCLRGFTHAATLPTLCKKAAGIFWYRSTEDVGHCPTLAVVCAPMRLLKLASLKCDFPRLTSILEACLRG